VTSFYRVEAQALTEVCSFILRQKGIPAADADIVANSLVDADLRGVNSHGVIRMSVYLNRLANGVIKASPNVQVVKETESTVVLDGGYGMGQVVSHHALNMLTKKVARTPLTVVTVRRSNHFGAAAYWASQLADKDMIGIAVSNVEPLMPPPGGTAARVGNNPIAIAVPALEEKPIILDMATSTVPLGKILNAKSKGESIPLGWAVDSVGQPTTNPDDVVNGGFLFPVGGPKGYGLAVMVDVLSALLSDGAIGSEIGSLYQDLERPNDISHFFMAIRIDAFMEPRIFKQSVDRYVRYVKNTPLAEGAKAIYLPGEIEMLNKEQNLQIGVLLPASVVEDVVKFARDADVDSDLIQTLLANPQN
jgi:ureidoglycolate dehydrogenase (NAD+)